MKKGIRILAIDGSAYGKTDADSLIIGVVGREDGVEGVISFRVGVDGSDATDKIIGSVSRSRFADQIRLVAVHGITLAGLNLVDIIRLNRDLKIPIVSIVRRKPHRKELEKAIRASKNGIERKLHLLKSIHENSETFRKDGFYFQCAGASKKDLAEVSEGAIGFLRLAHIVANGVARGESKGRI
jgi:uncharacterized protein